MKISISKALVVVIAVISMYAHAAMAQSNGNLSGVVESYSKSSGIIIISDKKYRIGSSTRVLNDEGKSSKHLSLDDLINGTTVEFTTDKTKPIPRIRSITPFFA
jgi:hypothetical protein